MSFLIEAGERSIHYMYKELGGFDPYHSYTFIFNKDYSVPLKALKIVFIYHEFVDEILFTYFHPERN